MRVGLDNSLSFFKNHKTKVVKFNIKRKKQILGLIGISFVLTSILSPFIYQKYNSDTLSSPSPADFSNDIHLYYSVSPIVFNSGEINIIISSMNNESFFFVWTIIDSNTMEPLLGQETHIYNITTIDNQISIPFSIPVNKPFGKIVIDLIIFRFDPQLNNFAYYSIKQFSSNVLFGPIISVGIALTFLLGIFFILIEDNKKNIIVNFVQSKNSFLKSIKFFHRKRFFPKQSNFDGNTENDKKYQYINCPDCQRQIIEGFAFCPECGYHLRTFERFKL